MCGFRNPKTRRMNLSRSLSFSLASSVGLGSSSSPLDKPSPDLCWDFLLGWPSRSFENRVLCVWYHLWIESSAITEISTITEVFIYSNVGHVFEIGLKYFNVMSVILLYLQSTSYSAAFPSHNCLLKALSFYCLSFMSYRSFLLSTQRAIDSSCSSVKLHGAPGGRLSFWTLPFPLSPLPLPLPTWRLVLDLHVGRAEETDSSVKIFNENN